MIRLEEAIFTWSVFNPEKQYNFNGFLLKMEEGVIVVDPPALSGDDEAYLSKLGLLPDLIVITNRNHVRALDWFLAKKKLPVAMHEAEVEQAGIAVDRRIKDGEHLLGGLVAVHLPGKSPGEIALHWPARNLLVVGDALIAPLGVLKLIPAPKLDDPAQLARSLQLLRGLDFDALLLADGDPILKGAKARVVSFLDGLLTA